MKRWDEVKGKYASKLASITTGTSTSTSTFKNTNSNNGGSGNGNGNGNGNKDEQYQNHSSTSTSASAKDLHVSKALERPERAREAKITKKLLIQESDSEEEEFGAVPKKRKIATSPVYASSGSARPKPIESAPVTVPVPQAPSGPILSVQLDKDMDDKTALSVVLQAAWEYLSVADVDSTFAVAVSTFMRLFMS